MTLTKEWLLKTIAEFENERDATPGAVNEDAAMALAAMKMALASMTAEPVAWQWFHLNQWHVTNDEERVRDLAWDGVKVMPLYAAPTAPVVHDALPKLKDGQRFKYVKDGIRYSANYANGWNACRAAMLQGAAGNSPAIPDGYALVPVEPTKEMIEAGWSYYMTSKAPGSSGVYSAMLAAAPQQEVNP